MLSGISKRWAFGLAFSTVMSDRALRVDTSGMDVPG
jgi:hypothetical protein